MYNPDKDTVTIKDDFRPLTTEMYKAYDSYRLAGFTDEQAFELVKIILQGGVKCISTLF